MRRGRAARAVGRRGGVRRRRLPRRLAGAPRQGAGGARALLAPPQKPRRALAQRAPLRRLDRSVTRAFSGLCCCAVQRPVRSPAPAGWSAWSWRRAIFITILLISHSQYYTNIKCHILKLTHPQCYILKMRHSPNIISFQCYVLKMLYTIYYRKMQRPKRSMMRTQFFSKCKNSKFLGSMRSGSAPKMLSIY